MGLICQPSHILHVPATLPNHLIVETLESFKATSCSCHAYIWVRPSTKVTFFFLTTKWIVSLIVPMKPPKSHKNRQSQTTRQCSTIVQCVRLRLTHILHHRVHFQSQEHMLPPVIFILYCAAALGKLAINTIRNKCSKVVYSDAWRCLNFAQF